ncbi:MAG: choice-of-anchor J domain-containing protein [Bacteroidota bacterium]|nr:choice-of-anchor J domain-containing protein [Bacteroidota bacterium]
MKKILTYIIGLTFLLALFTGCEDEEDIFRRGVGIYVSNSSFYPLDAGVTGDVTISDPSITSLNVTMDGSDFATISLTDGEGSFSFDKASLGIGDVDDAVTTKFTAMVDGQPASKYVTFSVIDPLSIQGPADFAPADTTIYIYYQFAEDCTAPTSLTITEQVNSETPVELTGSYDFYNDSVAVPITFEMAGDTLTYEFTFENDNGTLVTSHEILIIIKRFWDFESYAAWSTDMAPWTLVDNDGNACYTAGDFDYPGEGDPGSWRIFSHTEAGALDGWEAYSGDKYAFCFAAVPDGAVGNDDWMISTDFDIEDGYELSLYAKSITDAYGLERMIVKVVDNATSDETILTADVEDYVEVPTDWTNFKYDLSDWAGKNIHVEIGCVSYDAFALFVDDFEILTGEGKSISNGFEKSTGIVPQVEKIK